MPALRRTVVALTLTLGVLTSGVLVAGGLVAPAQASSPSPGPSGAAALRTEVERLSADLAAQSARLLAAQEAARAALERRQLAQRAAAQAERIAVERARDLDVARVRVAVARASLDGFAGALYRRGPQQQGMSYLAAALVTSDAGALLHGMEVAEQVGDGQGRSYDRFREAETAQRDATRRSQVARDRAVTLRAEADTAAEQARTAVAAQTGVVDVRTKELALAVDAAAVAERREMLLARAEQIARERSRAGIPLSALAGALVPRPTGTCEGGDLAGFRNGTLPPAALCPLWGTAGQVLRADAAAAFNALSRRYAEQYGFPLCVTDSYRNYAEQVAVRAAKPTLAAVPGSSNHGWGVALDLCGGAERFDTPLHLWLVEHAAEYGWFLPAWAQQGGSKPEPWHWEYAG